MRVVAGGPLGVLQHLWHGGHKPIARHCDRISVQTSTNSCVLISAARRRHRLSGTSVEAGSYTGNGVFTSGFHANRDNRRVYWLSTSAATPSRSSYTLIVSLVIPSLAFAEISSFDYISNNWRHIRQNSPRVPLNGAATWYISEVIKVLTSVVASVVTDGFVHCRSANKSEDKTNGVNNKQICIYIHNDENDIALC